jgi:TonB family protein
MMRRLLCLFVFFSMSSALPVAAQATLASAKPPLYPVAAKAAGIDGPVVVKALITKSGDVQNVHAISGPPELRQAAIDAVLNWKYHPYTHFGKPVEVDTTITVNFNMGTGQKKLDEQAKAKAELAKLAGAAASQESGTMSEPKQ